MITLVAIAGVQLALLALLFGTAALDRTLGARQQRLMSIVPVSRGAGRRRR